MRQPSLCGHVAASIWAVLAICGLGNANAQPYPSQPIKLIVPTPPGGMADLLARTLAQKLGETGTTMIVENRSGGGGAVGADAVAKAAPDGYTVFLGLHQTQAILPHLVQNLAYNALKDFQPVVQIAASHTILVVPPALPVRSVGDLIARAKAEPGRLTFASQGNGSLGHIGGELFKREAGIDIVHVPYRGAAPAIQDLLAGHVTMLFDILPLALPNVKAGRIRPLAVTSPQRAALAPDIPTMAELGLAGVRGGPWFGLLAPAGTPPAAVEWLNRATKQAFSADAIRAPLAAQGVDFVLGSPKEFAEFIATEHRFWGDVVRRLGITVR